MYLKTSFTRSEVNEFSLEVNPMKAYMKIEKEEEIWNYWDNCKYYEDWEMSTLMVYGWKGE